MKNSDKYEVLRKINEADWIDAGSGSQAQIYQMAEMYNAYFDDQITNLNNAYTLKHIWNNLIVLRQKIKKGELKLYPEVVEPIKEESKPIEPIEEVKETKPKTKKK